MVYPSPWLAIFHHRATAPIFTSKVPGGSWARRVLQFRSSHNLSQPRVPPTFSGLSLPPEQKLVGVPGSPRSHPLTLPPGLVERQHFSSIPYSRHEAGANTKESGKLGDLASFGINVAVLANNYTRRVPPPTLGHLHRLLPPATLQITRVILVNVPANNRDQFILVNLQICWQISQYHCRTFDRIFSAQKCLRLYVIFWLFGGYLDDVCF